MLETQTDGARKMAMALGRLAPATLFSLDGKVAFVTGAAGGIASGITQGLGARLALTDRSDEVADRAADLAGTGVTANTLAPGYIGTNFGMASNKPFHDFVSDWTPARRWGRPEDLSGPVLLLASEAVGYINGQTLYVDGGFLAVTRWRTIMPSGRRL